MHGAYVQKNFIVSAILLHLVLKMAKQSKRFSYEPCSTYALASKRPIRIRSQE